MRSLLLTTILSLLMVMTASAQFGKLRGKLKEKVSKETDKAILGAMTGNSDIETEEVYSYTFSVTYLATNEEMEKPTEIKQFFSAGKNYMGMEFKPEKNDMDIEQVLSIIDLDRSLFLILNEEEKQAMAMAFDPVEEQVEEQEEKEGTYSIEKTGATKKILGYTCEQYRYHGPEGSGDMWVTKEIDYQDFDMFAYLKRLQQEQSKENSIWTTDMEGFIMEMAGVDEDGKTFSLEAIDVDENAQVSVTMSEYQIMDLTGLQKMQGKMGDGN